MRSTRPTGPKPLYQPPYEAYAVMTGITFTFGGLKITTETRVEDISGRAIPGLFTAGEIVGGLYYHNYASDTGPYGRCRLRLPRRQKRGEFSEALRLQIAHAVACLVDKTVP
ncbi:MAG: FAD-binding protein [Alphaproteobacteria bacterium]|nr:FAD-binding protein [Alphaproteobacteria bacterium]